MYGDMIIEYNGFQIDLFMVTIAVIVVGHYIADFLMQSTWQATNKSHNIYALSQHIYVYSLTLLLTILPLVLLLPIGLSQLLSYVVLNGALHFATDFVSSKLSNKAFKEGNIPRFWAIIGADQMVHNLCLLLTLPILMP